MRKSGLDLCRVVACLGVVMSHTVMLFWDFDPASPSWPFFNCLNLASRYCVPLFFAISGALQLGREQLDFGRHLRRTGHFVLLFYLWSLILFGIDRLFLHVWTGEGSFLLHVLPGYYHEWFLPALILCYCAVPLLHGLLHGERENVVRGCLLIFVPVILLSTLAEAPDKPAWLDALLAPWSLGHLRFLVYMLMGWLLSQRLPSGRLTASLGVAALAAILLFSWLNRRYSVALGQASELYYDSFSVPEALSTLFLFCLCRHADALPAKLSGVLRELSVCTFGVYLLHAVFIDAFRSLHLDLARFSAAWLLPLCYICFLLLSFAAAWVLKKLPLLRRLVS